MRIAILGGGGFRVPMVYGALLARAERLGTLVASGMIVGESLFGVFNAGLIVAFSTDAPLALLRTEPSFAPVLGAVAFTGLVVWLYRWMLRKVRA